MLPNADADHCTPVLGIHKYETRSQAPLVPRVGIPEQVLVVLAQRFRDWR